VNNLLITFRRNFRGLDGFCPTPYARLVVMHNNQKATLLTRVCPSVAGFAGSSHLIGP